MVDYGRSQYATLMYIFILGGHGMGSKNMVVYYKYGINHKLEYQNYLYIVASVKKKINIRKIRTNSHELQIENLDMEKI